MTDCPISELPIKTHEYEAKNFGLLANSKTCPNPMTIMFGSVLNFFRIQVHSDPNEISSRPKQKNNPFATRHSFKE